jgi:hypothetical protein
MNELKSFSPEWAASLKPGDEVAVVNSNVYGTHWAIHIVDRVTPTMVALDGTRFNKKSGRDPDHRSIYVATKEVHDLIQYRKYMQGLYSQITAFGETCRKYYRAAPYDPGLANILCEEVRKLHTQLKDFIEPKKEKTQ